MIKTNKFKYNSNQKILNLSINHQNHVIFLLIKVGLPEKSKKKSSQIMIQLIDGT